MWAREVALELPVRARAHLPFLDLQVFVDHGARAEAVFVAPVDAVGLRVLAERHLGQDLLRRRPCRVGIKHLSRAERCAPGPASPTILSDPRRKNSAAAAKPQPVAEAAEIVTPLDMVALAGRQGERGSGLVGELHRIAPLSDLGKRILGKRWGSRLLIFPASNRQRKLHENGGFATLMTIAD